MDLLSLLLVTSTEFSLQAPLNGMSKKNHFCRAQAGFLTWRLGVVMVKLVTRVLLLLFNFWPCTQQALPQLQPQIMVILLVCLKHTILASIQPNRQTRT